MGRSRVILLTGFEPFGGETSNPSWQVASRLDGQVIEDLVVRALRLRVSYRHAARALTAAIDRVAPAAVLSLGQAAGRTAISLERVAINLIDEVAADNDRRRLTDTVVLRGGPAAYFSRLPLREIEAALVERGIPVELSLSAGSFICNAVMYAGLHRLRRRSAVAVGFIHLPYEARQVARQAGRRRGAPSLPLDSMVEAVRTAIVVIARHPHRLHA